MATKLCIECMVELTKANSYMNGKYVRPRCKSCTKKKVKELASKATNKKAKKINNAKYWAKNKESINSNRRKSIS